MCLDLMQNVKRDTDIHRLVVVESAVPDDMKTYTFVLRLTLICQAMMSEAALEDHDDS